MTLREDWLQDPLMIIENNVFINRTLKNPKNNQQEKWSSFHYATRLKLDGSVFFCRQVLGAASIPDEIGLPLLAHRQLRWYLEAFFFELMSAFDTLLQELNTIYAYNEKLTPEHVRWNDKKPTKFMGKLPENISQDITNERIKEWFIKVKRYRDTATHHYTVALSSGNTWAGYPINYSDFEINMQYFDEQGNYRPEGINKCSEYLKNMVIHIISIWQYMSQEFK